MKICIDPGHKAGYNKGVIPGYYEGDAMLDLALRLKKALEAYIGVQVVLTRTTGVDVSLAARGAAARGCEAFLSLHSDAGAATASGVSVNRSLQRPASAGLAKNLARAVAQTMGTGYHYAQDGVWTRAYPLTKSTDYYQVLREAVKAGCEHPYLIEHGFHTNRAECAWLDKSVNRQRLAEAEAACLAEYFGLRKPAATPKVTLYRFVTGPMTKGDAEQYRAALQQLQVRTGVRFSESVE